MNRLLVPDDSGQAAPLVATCLLALLALTALVIDGGVLFSTKREIQSLADAAARAGSMAIDETKLRESGGDRVELDPEAARRAAEEYLESSGFKGEWDVSADTGSTSVHLTQSHPTVLIGIAGIREMQTQASALAHPRTGAQGVGN